jgi:O-acetyl-ADP-ribose deacetylase (regulator of RNase III)
LFAFGPGLLFFSIFPDSSAEGNVGKFALGGAFASFVVVWLLGMSKGRQGLGADAAADALRKENADLRNEIALSGANAGDDPVITERQEIVYRVQGGDREIAIVTGDLLNVRDADVWVSSENTNMQPARYHDRSISALVRYHGAAQDEVGDPTEDVVGEELLRFMRTRTKDVVPAGAVIATSPGRLAETNGVKRIFHVAAVYGEPGQGYRPVADLGRCVTRVLERADHADEASYDLRTVLLPMLATGVARGAAAQIAPTLFGAAAEYLSSHPGTRVQRVCLLAWRRSELVHWRNAADACALVQRVTSGALAGAA